MSPQNFESIAPLSYGFRRCCWKCWRHSVLCMQTVFSLWKLCSLYLVFWNVFWNFTLCLGVGSYKKWFIVPSMAWTLPMGSSYPSVLGKFLVISLIILFSSLSLFSGTPGLLIFKILSLIFPISLVPLSERFDQLYLLALYVFFLLSFFNFQELCTDCSNHF